MKTERRVETVIAEGRSLHLIELLISRVLFWGALISIAVAAAGLMMYVRSGAGGDLQEQLRHQSVTLATFTSVGQIMSVIRDGANPLAISALGLLILLLVPVVSVALLIPAFFKEGDYRYSIMAGIVLIILLFGLVFGGT
jgi:uncharacterized membrane protein